MGVRIINPKDEARVVRSNKFLEARYESTLQQQRIMLWLISEIRQEDREFQTYRISIKELAEFVGVGSSKNIYQEMAAATRGMVGRVVEIGSLQDDEYLQVGLISSAKYRIGEGFIDLAISPELKPYLIELKQNFTQAYLRDLMQMKSSYSIRLYDLLHQYRKIGKRRIEVLELKRMLGIEKKYKEYKNFKARVVKPAVDEINARTDLHATYKELKQGRSVAELEFVIQVKEGFRQAEKDRAGEFIDLDLTARIISHGFKEEEAREFVKLYGEADPERLTFHLDQLEAGVESGKVKKPVPWFRKAVEEDYREQKSLFQKGREEAKKEAEERKAERQKRAKEAEALQTQMVKLDREYDEYRIGFIQELVATIEPSTLSEWSEEFKAELPRPLVPMWLKNPDFSARTNLGKAEVFLATKTGQACLEKEDWAKANGKPDYDELARQRVALL